MISAKKLSTNILILSIILAFFVAFNGDDANVRIAMLGYVAMAGLLILFLNGIKNFRFRLVGDYITSDILIGVGVGVGFIFLNKLGGLVSLGAPQSLIALGDLGKFIALVLVAPIIEEFFFRGFLLPRFLEAFRSPLTANFLQAGLFSVFHFAVYGGFLGLASAYGVFIGAALFGLVAGFLVTNSSRGSKNTLERVIVAHAIFNFYLWNLATGSVVFLT